MDQTCINIEGTSMEIFSQQFTWFMMVYKVSIPVKICHAQSWIDVQIQNNHNHKHIIYIQQGSSKHHTCKD